MENNEPSLSNIPFFKTVIDDEIIVVFEKEVREDEWGDHFGNLQSLIKNKKCDDTNSSTHLRQISLDFSKCTWFDPIPLMHFMISIDEFEDTKSKIIILLPDYQDDDIEYLTRPEQIEKNIFLKFLSSEGFLEMMLGVELRPDFNINASEHRIKNIPDTRTIVFESGELLTFDTLEKIKDLKVDLNFKNCTCLPAKLIKASTDINNTPDIRDKFVDEIVEFLISRFISISIDIRLPFWARSSMKYKISILLKEIIRNSFEHGYSGSVNTSRVIVYTRYRFGKLEQEPLNHPNEQLIDIESKRNLLLGRSFPDRRKGFFEIFVADNGIGLQASYQNRKNLQNILSDTIELSKLKNRPRKKTDISGLGLVGKILSNHMDQVRVHSNGEWWGKILPSEAPSKVWTVSSRGKVQPQGLAWLFRASWLEPSDIFKNGWKFPSFCSQGIPEYLNSNDNLKESSNNIEIVDWRFFTENEQYITNINNSRRNILLFLPPPRTSKDDIVNYTLRLLQEIDNEAMTLIIADIPSEEAITYALTFQATYEVGKKYNAGIRRHVQSGKLEKVILVTRSFTSIVFSKRSFEAKNKSFETFDNDDNLSDIYVKSLEEGAQNSLSELHKLLRWYDSKVFWKVIRENNEANSCFVRANINWGGDVTLGSYLDLSKALINNTCVEIVRLSLQRLAFIHGKDLSFQFSFMDNILQSVIKDVNAILHLDTNEEKFITIGSICVSQITEKHQISNEFNHNDHVLYVFKHNDSKANVAYLLMWPDNKWDWYENLPFDSRDLRRVGTSAVIAEFGWLGYPLHRYRDGNSIYARTPKESYEDWQDSNVELAKLGHWEFEGHHDLITINIQQAFRADFEWHRNARETSLFNFLFKHLFTFFNIKLKDINTKYHWKVSRVVSNNTSNCMFRNRTLVYPSHPVTDYIISTFVNILTLSGQRALIPSIIPLKPLRNSRQSSSFLISGLTIDNLKHRSSFDDAEIKILDDAMISGRTSLEIEKLMTTLGFNKVSKLAVLDRQRLPSSDHILNEKNDCYWRLDLPLLGSSTTCPICSSLKVMELLTNRIGDSSVKERLLTILRDWKVKSTVTDWQENGVTGIAFKHSDKLKKKFGVEVKTDNEKSNKVVTQQIGGSSNKIELKNTLGISIYLTEMHTMTFNDALLSKFLRKNSKLSSDAIIEILSTQLLYFANEFDIKNKQVFLKMLFKEMLSYSEIPNYRTSLGLITLFAYTNETDQLLKSINKNDNLIMNNDFLILMIYAATTIKDFEIHKYIEVERVLADKYRKVLTKYHWFSRQVKDVYGEQHTGYIHLLTKKGEWCTNSELRKRISSVLENLVEESRRLNGQNFNSYQIDTKLDDLKLLHSKQTKQLTSILDSAEISNSERKEINILSLDVIETLNRIHAGFFMPINIGEGYPIENFTIEINKIIKNECSGIKKIQIKGLKSDDIYKLKMSLSSFKEVYILFDRISKNVLLDRIKNAICGDNETIPPIEIKTITSNSKSYDAILEVKFDDVPNGVIIEITNNSVESHKKIEEKLKPKPYVSEFHEREGHDIYYSSVEIENYHRVKTIIFLPFVHRFGGNYE